MVALLMGSSLLLIPPRLPLPNGNSLSSPTGFCMGASLPQRTLWYLAEWHDALRFIICSFSLPFKGVAQGKPAASFLPSQRARQPCPPSPSLTLILQQQHLPLLTCPQTHCTSTLWRPPLLVQHDDLMRLVYREA